jgi:DNA-directed RNA polymerase specialized sigma24 family protein
VAAIEKVVLSLAAKFRFGYFDREDMKQQARLFAVQLINKRKYDPNRPLENFLYTHVRNRLINFKRDNYKRSEPPCVGCPFYDKLCKQSKNQCTAFEKREDCKKYMGWVQRNQAKQGLMHPMDIASIFDERLSHNHSSIKEVELRELLEMIERSLPTVLLDAWQKARMGDRLRKAEREKLQRHIIKIFGPKEEHNGEEG